MKARLDKILSQNGYGSRKEIKKLLRKKECIIGGRRIVDSSFVVDCSVDEIYFDNRLIKPKTNIYIMFNKPAGCVTSTNDPVNKTVMEYLLHPYNQIKLFPIGRLDIDTEGLLIITNDGEITHRLTSPKTGIQKSYYLEFSKEPENQDFEFYKSEFEKGITLKNGYKCLKAEFQKAENITGSGKQGFILSITEGKYHQVKKMCLAVNNELCYLRRVKMGPVNLDPLLEKGKYRELSEKEIESLKDL